MELSGTHVIARLTATDEGIRLDARTTSGDRLGEPRLTRLPKPLSTIDEKKALSKIVQRLDMGVRRGEEMGEVLDDVALIRLNRAGAVLMPRSSRSAPAREVANNRSDRRAGHTIGPAPRLQGSGSTGDGRPARPR